MKYYVILIQEDPQDPYLFTDEEDFVILYDTLVEAKEAIYDEELVESIPIEINLVEICAN